MNGETYTANEIILGSPTIALKKDGVHNQEVVFEEGLEDFLITNNIASTLNETEYLTLDEFSKALTGLDYEELKEDTNCEDENYKEDYEVKDTDKSNNYKKHFERELEIIKKGLKEGDRLAIEDFIEMIKDITDIFNKQGHSGSSAPFYNSILTETIKNVLSFKPLSGITCEDYEWNAIGGISHTENIYQNKREGAVFKNGKSGEPYYLDAIVWKGEEDWDTFTGTVDGINSRQFINLPFTPKTFYIDVVKDYNFNEDEDPVVDKDETRYVYRIKDRKQLLEVAEYYNTHF